MRLIGIGILVCVLLLGLGSNAAAADRPNVVFILVDDMRFDAMSCAGHPFLKTPGIDALAEGGVRFSNAFVTTSLCSPSRASFLTGLYAHRHGVLNNFTHLDPALPTFPQLLQKSGYRTGFIGKWHMGHDDDSPRPGFDYWASFQGQGAYFVNNFNINGEHQKIEEYVTDAITRLATEWIDKNHDAPFMLYVSHKAVHGPFSPPPRYVDRYADVELPLPETLANTPDNYHRKPEWVRQQRQSFHGVDDMYFKGKYHTPITLEDLIREYCRCMLAIDDSVAAITESLRRSGVFDNTLVILAGDNGFLLGEHGMIDKRSMYEESIRIPMIASWPAKYGTQGRVDPRMVLNIDVMPTICDAAGVDVPAGIDGVSFASLPIEPDAKWRDAFAYLYFWEPPFPETPTCLGIRTDRYKYIEYQGIWDTNELYDLQKDPHEKYNHLLTSRRKEVTPDEGYADVYNELRQRLRKELDAHGALYLPSWKK